MKLRPIVAALAAVAAVAAGSASALPPRAQANVAYVSHSPNGANRSCGSPVFNTVQAAVDAVPAKGTVYLCGTTAFEEQVFLGKSVTITGDPGAKIVSPKSANAFADVSSGRFPLQFQRDGLFAPQAIVVVTGTTTKATIKGIEVRGPLPGNGGCKNREYGVLVLEGYLNLTHASVTDARNADGSLNGLSGCQFGVGVQVGSTKWPTADWSSSPIEKFNADAEVDNTTVIGYQKNGIVIDGSGSGGDIHDNIVKGSQTDVIAQNGIEVVFGATGEVYDNNVSGNQYTGLAGDFSTGVLLYGGGGYPLVMNVEVHDNILGNNDVGISMENYNPTGDGPATIQTKNRAYNNTVKNSAITNLNGSCGVVSGCGRGYQAGIAVIGNRDEIGKNMISGPGYAQTDTSVAWVAPTDFTSTTKGYRNVYKP